jgi:hypothetical protein
MRSSSRRLSAERPKRKIPMIEPTEIPNIVYVKYESADGKLRIGRHVRPALLDPNSDLSDFVREIVQSYKVDPNLTYLGLADYDEYEAFTNLSRRDKTGSEEESHR